MRLGIKVVIAVLSIAIVFTVAVLIANNYGKNTKPANPIKLFRTSSQPEPQITVPIILSGHDEDNDGIDDLNDIVRGARAEAKRQPTYKNAYYKGGFPPENEGVCTDVIWRAFKDAGYDLKDMVDSDIAHNTRAYPRVDGKPDPNIDFRRVPNLASFFERHANKLTTKISPGDKSNLMLWQGGDIVVFGKPFPHIGIISDRRRDDGVPFLIHNAGPCASENDYLLSWPSPITHHFRYPKHK
jgi:uncharacterized protein YijF (DUF1287 family)